MVRFVKENSSSIETAFSPEMVDVEGSGLLEDLDRDAFVQCHQGYIVNVDKIRAYRDKTLFLDGSITLPVSRGFAGQVKGVLANRLFAGREPL